MELEKFDLEKAKAGSDNKWTPEPWPISSEYDVSYVKLLVNDYKRAVECVNALAGVESPKEYLETILKQREELAEQVKKMTAVITEHINRNV